jgi:tetratricopeptide (TPR) repeat protein
MSELPDEQHAEEARELDRLFRFLTRPGPRFGLGLAVSRDPAVANELRERLRRMIEVAGVKLSTVVFDAHDEREDLVARMRDAAQGVDAVFVLGLDRLLLDSAGRVWLTSAVANLNQRRDSLPALLNARVVFWLGKAGHSSMRDQAWDLRQIMMTVAEFERQALVIATPLVLQAAREGLSFVDEREIDEVVAHADTLTRVAEGALDLRTRADAAFSAGQAYASARRFDAAVQWLVYAVAAYDGIDDIDQASAARAVIGDVLFALGRVEDAIASHERALAGYVKLGRLDAEATELANLGICYQRLANRGQARRYLTRAQEQLGRWGLPEDHPDVVRLSHALAELD